MNRRAAGIVVALCINTVPLHAQNAVFKVTADSADVYKAPSTGSPVIGHAPRGAAFEIARDLGSWVKIAWPSAADGVGYLHVTMGAISRATTESGRAAPASATRPATASPIPPPAPRRSVRADETSSTHAAPGYVRPPAHMFGVGGRLGGPDLNVGATARAWASNRFGLQVDLSRGATDAAARVTSLQLAPSVIYAFRDRVSDYWWLRPYVGAGPTLERNSLDTGLRDPIDPVSDTRFGVQGFGGVEMTFASMPKLAVSADFGVRARQSSTLAVDDSGPRFVMSVHWYLK
jgi:hypothetical protein